MKRIPNTKISNFSRDAARLTVTRAQGDGGVGAGEAGGAASGGAATSSSDSFLGMWKRAQEKEREAIREAEARKRAEEQGAAQAAGDEQGKEEGESADVLKKREAQFLQMLEQSVSGRAAARTSGGGGRARNRLSRCLARFNSPRSSLSFRPPALAHAPRCASKLAILYLSLLPPFRPPGRARAQVPKEVRQEAERKAVVDRAAAALAAAQALLVEAEERARKERQASRGRRLAGAGDQGATSSVWGGKSLSVVKEKGGKKGGEGKAAAGGAVTTKAASAGGTGGGGGAAGAAAAGGLGGFWKAIPSRAKKSSSGSSSSPPAAAPAAAAPVAKPASPGAAKQPSSGASSGVSSGGSSSPGPSFWEWAPPSDTGGAGGAGLPQLQPAAPKPARSAAQRATVTIADPQPQLLEALLLPFESAVAPTKPASAGEASTTAGGTGGVGGAGGVGGVGGAAGGAAGAAGSAAAAAASPAAVASAAALDLASASPFLASDVGLPPLQSALEAQRGIKEALQAVFASDAAEPAGSEADGATVAADGSRWWKESGTEVREGGEVCDWTVVRGVSADGSVEWEEKWWEASDEFDFKELGAEKSGRDANGAVWRETWREATWQDSKTGLMHIEKTADKWGQNGEGGEWHEKWWEHYDATGRAEKWADKWSKIDMYTPLYDGHAHTWHERWGEEYDGRGAASKRCDKWAKRFEGHNGFGNQLWAKWDEKFNRDKTGYRQGETWWGEEYDGRGAASKWCDNWAERFEGHAGYGNQLWAKWGDKTGYRQGESWWQLPSRINGLPFPLPFRSPPSPLHPSPYCRWGEEYDGRGAASKWCDKWAERFEGHDGYGNQLWAKWGDKWDEKFNRDKTGYRQGETWWQGSGGDDAPRWNKVWSEGHDGSGWVHKKGGASSGEGWDVREWMDTWFDAFPHFGFKQCLENSRRLMEVGRRQGKKQE
ncbi:unnamed protein product [Closterium sp. NIES-53]